MAAVAAAVIAGTIVKKNKQSSQVTLAPRQPIAALPETTAAEKTVVEKTEVTVQTVPVQAVQTPVAATAEIKPIKPIKTLKAPKADKTKAMLDKAAARAVDMTVQVIRRLAGI